MDPFGREFPQMGPSFSPPSFTSHYRFSTYCPSYEPPKTTRNGIGKSIQSKPTNKDIQKSMQSKLATNDIRETKTSENNNPIQSPEDSYAKAYDFVTNFNKWRSGELDVPNPDSYEKNFTIQMSTKEWIMLSEKLNLFENDDPYPRYSFNSATSTLIIQCTTSAIHESITNCFMRAIAKAEDDLPDLAQSVLVSNQSLSKFGGKYAGSSKIADMAVQARNANGRLETKLVVEVGFSEGYDALIDDARLWLEGMNSVSVCILVCFDEEPRYQCPVDIDMEDEEFDKLGFPDEQELSPEDFHLEGPFGPAIYRGRVNEELDNEDEAPDDEEATDEEAADEEAEDEEAADEEAEDEEAADEEAEDEEAEDEEAEDEEAEDEEAEDEEAEDEEAEDEEAEDEEAEDEKLVWVGRISTAFLEWWVRDAKTGKAKKYGKRRELATARKINFKRSSFMEPKAEDDRTISINCDNFRMTFPEKIRELAAERCRAMLRRRAKNSGQ